VSDIIGVTFLLSLLTAIYITWFKTPEDQFVGRAFKFLILALLARLLMGAKVYLSGGVYEPLPENQSGDKVQTVPWQQVYFEVPFYMFLIVPMAMLFSWKVAYAKLINLITSENDEEHEE
jgi:hypothetical protein